MVNKCHRRSMVIYVEYLRSDNLITFVMEYRVDSEKEHQVFILLKDGP